MTNSRVGMGLLAFKTSGDGKEKGRRMFDCLKRVSPSTGRCFLSAGGS